MSNEKKGFLIGVPTSGTQWYFAMVDNKEDAIDIVMNGEGEPRSHEYDEDSDYSNFEVRKDSEYFPDEDEEYEE